MSADPDRNDLAFWYPLIKAAGLPVPDTAVVTGVGDLDRLLDGETPERFDALVAAIRGAGDLFGWPCFLRTGHGSGKHDWRNTCYLRLPDEIEHHVYNLVEWSHLVDMMGLPTQTWAVRRMLDTDHLFTCERYSGMPVVREFRVFINDDYPYHIQPYWPPDAAERGGPDRVEWRDLLAEASRLRPGERDGLYHLAVQAHIGVGGGDWSVDLLQDRSGKWWLTDMAQAADSFRWDPET